MRTFRSRHTGVAYAFALSSIAVVATHAGCSSDSGGDTADAGTDRGVLPVPVPVDGGPACDPTKPFGEPVYLPSASVAGTESGMLSADELTYYSMNMKERWFHLYSATRTTTDADFGVPIMLKNVNNPTDVGDYDPYVSSDGLELFFSSERPLGGAAKNFNLYYATRTSLNEDFSAPTPVPNLNTDRIDRSPALSADKKTLYFTSNGRGDGDPGAIYRSARSGPNFGDAIRVNLGATGGIGDGSPVPSPNELTLFFGSGRDGKGNGDVWMATRTTQEGNFTGPTNAGDLVNVNGPNAEGPRGISPDGCRLYLTSNRPAPQGASGYEGWNMWVATRPK